MVLYARECLYHATKCTTLYCLFLSDTWYCGDIDNIINYSCYIACPKSLGELATQIPDLPQNRPYTHTHKIIKSKS